MNTKLHDKWYSQYREIYQAIANLQDELGNHMSIIITDDTNTKYYLPFSSLGDLIQ